MRAVVHDSPADFLSRAKEYLAATVFENNPIVGLATRAVREPGRHPQGIWCVTLEEGDRIAGVALQTPPWPVLLSPMGDGAADTLAEWLRSRRVPGFVGTLPVVERLSSALGLVARDRRRLRFYVLRERPPLHAVPGRLRAMAPSDREIALRWVEAFDRELREPRAVIERERAVDLGIAGGHFFFWEDGVPVSMANRVETPPDGCRLGAVYTPPDFRRRGYAGAMVAAVSRASLDEGRAWCCLYTDLDNPTSNAIYQRIGYRAVYDSVKVEFVERV